MFSDDFMEMFARLPRINMLLVLQCRLFLRKLV
jgi:hypothetical protein